MVQLANNMTTQDIFKKIGELNDQLHCKKIDYATYKEAMKQIHQDFRDVIKKNDFLIFRR